MQFLIRHSDGRVQLEQGDFGPGGVPAEIGTNMSDGTRVNFRCVGLIPLYEEIAQQPVILRPPLIIPRNGDS